MEISSYNRHSLLGTDPRDLQQTSRVGLNHKDQAILIIDSEIRFFQYDIGSVEETEVNIRPFSVRPVDYLDSGVWIEKEVPSSRFSMLKSEYASATDGVVSSAEIVKGLETTGAGKYYGTNAANTGGFHPLPTEIDKAVNLKDVEFAGNDKYYGTNEAGDVGFHTQPTIAAEPASRRYALIFG